MYSAPFAAPQARNRQLAGAYHHVGVQTAVTGATPHQLVAMLFDGFFAALNRARGAMRNRAVNEKVEALAHAVRIVDEGLKAGLNIPQGGKLAGDLNDLYAYVCVRLTQANLRNDEAALDECIALMQPLRDAWSAIAAQVEPQSRR